MASQQANQAPDPHPKTFTKKQSAQLFAISLQIAEEQLTLLQTQTSLFTKEHEDQKERLDSESEVRKECMEGESDALIARTKKSSDAEVVIMKEKCVTEQEMILREANVKRKAMLDESDARIREGKRLGEVDLEEKKRFGRMAVDVNWEESLVRQLCGENESWKRMEEKVPYENVLDAAKERMRAWNEDAE